MLGRSPGRSNGKVSYDPVATSESDPGSDGNGGEPSSSAGRQNGNGALRRNVVLICVAAVVSLSLAFFVKSKSGASAERCYDRAYDATYDAAYAASNSVGWPQAPNSTSPTVSAAFADGTLPWPAHIRPTTDYKFYYPVDPGGSDHRWPRVAWIMSFPNSGTSYTMRLVQTASGRMGGSNYGKECDVDKETGENFPIYDDSPSGPFLSRRLGNKEGLSVPERYVPVKTHCTGYTTESGPDKYAMTVRSFQEKCLSGNVIHPERDPKTGKIVSARGKPNSMVDKEITFYNASLVQRAVHIIRDPFDNIVSRFHLEQHAHAKRGEEEWTSKYPGTPEGFKNWCKDLDERYRKDEEKSRFVDKELLGQFGKVPCHAEFHRYAQWHNLAVAVTRRMRLPSHVLHYENYESDFTGTYNDLFFFLELPREGEVPEFVTGKSYAEYFTKEERSEGMALVRMVAEPETWELLDRYDRYK